MSLLLILPSAAALAMLVIHGWYTRYRATLVGFLITAVVFGLIHGGVVWYVFTHVEQDVQASMPFFIDNRLIGDIGFASLQEIVGWAFAALLAWTVSEFILRRLPNLRDHLFVTAALSSLFMLAICYCMETAAVRVGWWYWSLPTGSDLYGNVNTFAMTAWFSVVPDFLLPFLAFACPARERRISGWPWLLLWLPHPLGILILGWNVWAHVTTIFMALLVVGLMLFGRYRILWGRIEDAQASPLIRVLPGAALAIFFAVVVAADIAGGRAEVDLWTVVPLLVLCLLAWRVVPVTVVVGLSLLALTGWWWIGARALYALVPVGAYGFLRLLNNLRRPVWLKLAATALTVAGSVLVIFWNAAERDRSQRYMDAWAEGDRFALAGSSAQAADAYRRADELRPDDTLSLYCAIQRMAQTDSGDAASVSRAFRHRTDRIVRELEETSRRDRQWTLPHEDLAHLYLLLGKPAPAMQHYREILRWRPESSDGMVMLGYLLLLEGKTAEAEEVCARALRLRKPPVEAVINLGVIRFSQERDDEARRLWRQALSEDPGNGVARLNAGRLDERAPQRGIDARYLARRPVTARHSRWTEALAAGRGPAANDPSLDSRK